MWNSVKVFLTNKKSKKNDSIAVDVEKDGEIKLRVDSGITDTC